MTTRLTLRRRLIASTALVGGAIAVPALAQVMPTTLPDVTMTTVATQGLTAGAGTPPGAFNPVFTPGGTVAAPTLTIGLNNNGTVINYGGTGFNIGSDAKVIFTDTRAGIPDTTGATPNIAVVNRDLSGNPSFIQGTLTSDANVAVYVINTQGITFGSGANVNVGALIASSLDLDAGQEAAFLAGNPSLRFSGLANATTGIIVEANTNLSSLNGTDGLGQLVLLGAFVDAQGGIQAAKSDLAFVAATDVTMAATPGSPLAFTINAGTSVSSTVRATGTVRAAGAASGQNVTLAFATQDAITDALLSVTGSVTATTATATDRGVLLSAGFENGAAGFDLGGTETNGAGSIIASGAITQDGTSPGGAAQGTRIFARDSIVATGKITTGFGTSFVQTASGNVQVDELQGSSTVFGTSFIGSFGAGATTVGKIDVGPGGDINIGGNIGTTTINGAVIAGGFVNILSGNLVIGAAATEITGGGAVTLRSSAGSIVATNNVVITSDSDGAGNESIEISATGGAIDLGALSTLRGGTARSGDVRIFTASTADALTLGNVEARGLFATDAVFATTDPFNRTGAVSFGNLGLTQGLSVTTTQAITTGAITITGGGLALTASGATSDITAAALIETQGDLALGAGRDVTITTARSNGGDASVTAGRDTIGQALQAAGSAAETAGGNAGILNVTGGFGVSPPPITANVTIVGATVDKAAVTAGGALSITATTGQLSLGTGSAGTTATLTKQGAVDELSVGTLTSGNNATVTSATNARIGTVTSTAGAIGVTATLGDVTGRALAPAATDGRPAPDFGRATLTATNTMAGDVTVTAGGAAQFGTVTAGRALSITTVGVLDLLTGSAGTTALLRTTGPAGELRVGTLTSGDAATVRSTASARIGTVTSTTGAILVDATQDVTGLALAPAATDGRPAPDFGRATLTATNTMAGDVTVTAGGAGQFGTVTAGRALSITTVGGLDLTTGSAGTTALLRTTGAAGTIVAGTLTSGTVEAGAATIEGTATVDSAASARLGTVRSRTGSVKVAAVGDVTGLVATPGATGANLRADGFATPAYAGTVEVDAGGRARLNDLTARGTVDVDAVGIAEVHGAVSAGGDYLVEGSAVTLGDSAGARAQSANGAVRIRSTAGAVTGLAGLTLTANADAAGADAAGAETLLLDATGGGIAFGAASLVGAANRSSNIGIRLATDGAALVLGTVSARGLYSADAAGVLAVATGLTTTGPVTLGTTTLRNALSVTTPKTITTGAISITGTGQGLSLTATEATADIVATALIQSQGDLVLNAGRDVTITTARSNAGNASVTAGRDTIGDLLQAAGSASEDAGRSAGITDVASGVSGIPGDGDGDTGNGIGGPTPAPSPPPLDRDVTIRGGTVNKGTVIAGGALSITATTGQLSLVTGSAGTTATLTKQGAATGELSVGTLTSGNNATVTSATNARIGTVTSTAGAIGVTATLGDVTGRALAPAATDGRPAPDFGRATLTATNTMAGDVTVTAGGAGQFGTVTAGRALSITTVGVLDLLTGTAGTTALLRTTGPAGELRVGTLTSGGDATVRAATSARIGTVTSTAGAILVDATQDVTGLRLAADATPTVGPAPTFGRATLTASNTMAGDVTVTAGGAAQFGTVTAGRALSITTGNDLDLLTGTAGTTALLRTTDPVTSVVTGTATPRTGAPGNIVAGTLSSGGNATVASAANARIGTVTSTTGAIQVEAIRDVTGLALAVDATPTVGPAPTFGRATLTASNTTAGDVTVTAGGAAQAGTVTAGRALSITTGNDLDLVTGTAGTTALLRTTDPVTGVVTGTVTPRTGAAGTIVAGSLTSGTVEAGAATVEGTATVDSAASARLGTVRSRTGSVKVAAVGDVTGLVATPGATGANLRADGFATPAYAGTVEVDAGGRARLNDLTARGTVDVDAVGIAEVHGNVSAGGDYLVEGSAVTLGDSSGARAQAANGAVRIRSTAGAVTGLAGLTLTANADAAGADAAGAETLLLDATGGGIAFGAASLVGAANRSSNIGIRLATDGAALVLGTVSARGLYSADAAGVLAVATGLTTTGPVTLGTTTLRNALSVTTPKTITTGAISITGTGQGLSLTATEATADIVATALIQSQGDLVLNAGRDVTITTARSNAGNASVTAGRDTIGDLLQAAGSASEDAGRSAGITDVASGVSGIPGDGDGDTGNGIGGPTPAPSPPPLDRDVTIRGGTVNKGTVIAGGALSITATTGQLSLVTGSAGTTATLTKQGAATGELSVGTLTSGNNATVTSATNARIGTVTSTAGAIGVTATLGDVTGRALAPAATDGRPAPDFGRATLTATNTMAGDVTVTAGGAGQFGTVTAGRALSITTVGVLDLLTGTAGTTALLRTTGPAGELRVGTLTSGGDATVRAATSARIGTVTSTAGAILVDATQDVTGLALAPAATDGRPAPDFGRATLTATNTMAGDVTVTAGGAGQFGTVTAGRALSITTVGGLDLTTGTAGTTALLRTTGAAGNIVVSRLAGGTTTTVNSAANVRLGTVTSGDGLLAVTAAQDVTGLALASDARPTVGPAPTFGRGTLTAAGAAGDVTVDARGAIQLDSVGAARNVRLGNSEGTPATVDVLTTTAANAARVTAGTLAMLGSIEGTAATVDVTAARVTIGTATAGTVLTATATNGDLTLTSGTSGGATNLATTVPGSGDVIVTTLNAGGAIGITSVSDARLGDITTTAGDVTVMASAGEVTGIGAGAANLAGPAAITVTAGTLARLGTVTAGTNLAVTADTISATTATATAGSLSLIADVGGITLGTGKSGTTALLRTTGAAGDIVITRLDGGTTTTVESVGNVRLGTVTSGNGLLAVRAARDVTGLALVADATPTVGPAPTFGRGTLTAAGAAGDVTVAAGGLIQLASVGASRDATLGSGAGTDVLTTAAANAARVTAGTLATLGSITGTAATVDVTAATVTIGTATAGTALTATASNGDLTLATGKAGTTATLATTGPGSGDVIVTTLNAGGAIGITSVSDARLGDITTTAGAVTVTASAGEVTGIGAGAANLAGPAAVTVTAGTLARLGTVTAGTNLAVTADTISAATATATAGSLSLIADVGGITLGTGTAGTTATLDGAGAVAVTTSLTANGGLLSVIGASVDILRATGAQAIDIRARSGTLNLVTGSAGTTATLNKLGTTGVLSATTLNARGATMITSSTSARLGDVVTTAGAVTVTASAGEVTGIGTGAANLTGPADITVTGGTLARLGTVTAGTTLGVTADTISATTARATAGALSLVADAGAVSVGTAAAGTSAILDASGAATLGTGTASTSFVVNAGTTATIGNTGANTVPGIAAATVTIRANDAQINDSVAGSTSVAVVNRSTTPLRLGNFGTADTPAQTGAAFTLDSDEVNRIATPTLTFRSGSAADAITASPVAIGNLALGNDVGSLRFEVLTSGRIDLTGGFVATGPAGGTAARIFQLGGTARGAGVSSALSAAATAGAGGRVLLEGNTLIDLRATRIAFGQSAGFLNALGLGTTTPSAADVATNYVANPNSSLYVAGAATAAGIGVTYTSPVLLRATTLAVTYGDFALFQNTGSAGLGSQTSGVTVVNLVPNSVAFTSTGPNAGLAAPNSFALFGSIGDRTGTAAALLGPDIIVLTAVNPTNARINGCLVGSGGGGCLITTISPPQISVFDQSQINIFKSVDDLTIAFDPVVGTNNEALFSDLGTVDFLGDDLPDCDGNDDTACAKDGAIKP